MNSNHLRYSRSDDVSSEDDHPAVQPQPQIARKPVAHSSQALLGQFESPPESNKPHYPPRPMSSTRSHGSKSVDGKSNGTKGLMRRWVWEICSLLVGTAALVAIIVTLHVFENKSLESWKAPISINAVVAILSALFRGALLVPVSSGIAQLKWQSFSRKRQALANMDTYDQASRGAWGAVILLTRQIGGARISPIATVGAVTILLVLIAEPFSQATVLVGICDRVTPGIASMPRANSYAGATHVGANQEQISNTMTLAVYQGLYNDFKSSSQLMESAVVCPSGNCTFSLPVTLQTATMCHSCRDVSDRIRGNGSEPFRLTGYSSTFNIEDRLPLATNTSTFYYNPSLSDTKSDDSIYWPDGPWPRTSLFDFQGIAYIPDRNKCTPGFGPVFCGKLSQKLAFDCSLRPCVKTLRASMTNHGYKEEEVSRAYMHVTSAVRPDGGKFQLGLNDTFINGTWMACRGDQNISESHPKEVATWPTLTPAQLRNNTAPKPLYYPEECVYEFGRNEFVAMYSLLSETFRNVTLGHNVGGDPAGTPWITKLWADGNITMGSVDSYVENLANTIGQEMRSNNGVVNYSIPISPAQWDATGLPVTTPVPIPEEFKTVRGDMHNREPCINVHWPFLAFLAVLLVLEFGFVIAVLVADGAWQADWKSAILPILFQAVHEEDEDGVQLLQRHRVAGATEEADSNVTVCDRDEFYKRAEAMNVQLVKRNGGWEFDAGMAKGE